MANSEKVGATITDRDAEVLAFLEDVRVEVLIGDDRGFKLYFHFKENPYLLDKVRHLEESAGSMCAVLAAVPVTLAGSALGRGVAEKWGRV